MPYESEIKDSGEHIGGIVNLYLGGRNGEGKCRKFFSAEIIGRSLKD